MQKGKAKEKKKKEKERIVDNMIGNKKEEEKNEKSIRGLLKLAPNKTCINCCRQGPQYVCINFWTFICVTCSGIHREFNHRVKSVSMAKFTTEEVNSLQAGGNQRAKEILLKEWVPQVHHTPDSSNPESLREFIRQVYVQRRYADGETTSLENDTLPRDVIGDGKNYSTYHADFDTHELSRDSVEEHYSTFKEKPSRRRFSFRTRSNRCKQLDQRKSPKQSKVVDENFEARKSEEENYSTGEIKEEKKSVRNAKRLDWSALLTGPFTDNSEENIATPNRESTPHETDSDTLGPSTCLQEKSPSSKFRSIGLQMIKLKKKNSGNFVAIANSEPPAMPSVEEIHEEEPAAGPTNSQPRPHSIERIEQLEELFAATWSSFPARRGSSSSSNMEYGVRENPPAELYSKEPVGGASSGISPPSTRLRRSSSEIPASLGKAVPDAASSYPSSLPPLTSMEWQEIASTLPLPRMGGIGGFGDVSFDRQVYPHKKHSNKKQVRARANSFCFGRGDQSA